MDPDRKDPAPNERRTLSEEANVDSIFCAAAELEAQHRGGYLDRACRHDPDLREQVERLLKAEAQAGDFMRDGAAALESDTEIRTGTATGVLRRWRAERSPIRGDVERVRLWVEVITGFELDAEDELRALDGPQWREHRERLGALGGAPTKQ